SYVAASKLPTLEKMVLIELLAGGNVAATATVMKPASNAYSTRSWPAVSFHKRETIRFAIRFFITVPFRREPPSRHHAPQGSIIPPGSRAIQLRCGHTSHPTRDVCRGSERR